MSSRFGIWMNWFRQTTFLILSHKIHIFFVSRNHFTFMFGGQIQLNADKNDVRNVNKCLSFLIFLAPVYREKMTGTHQFVSRLKRAIITINNSLNWLARSALENMSRSFFCRFMDFASGSVHILAKQERDEYSPMWTSCRLNNIYVLRSFETANRFRFALKTETALLEGRLLLTACSKILHDIWTHSRISHSYARDVNNRAVKVQVSLNCISNWPPQKHAKNVKRQLNLWFPATARYFLNRKPPYKSECIHKKAFKSPEYNRPCCNHVLFPNFAL